MPTRTRPVLESETRPCSGSVALPTVLIALMSKIHVAAVCSVGGDAEFREQREGQLGVVVTISG